MKIVVAGMDYQPGPTTLTLPISTMNGATFEVLLEILNDTAVEGDHSFFVEVEESDLVIPGSNATIQIIDNDCEGLSLRDFTSQLLSLNFCI